MRIINIASATVIVETKNVRILMDPWLVDGEYYGSWYHFPKIDLEQLELDSINYIYLSHIHPDHFSIKTFELFDRDIPVIIHNYSAKFLRTNIERLGFKVVELDHGFSYSLTSEVSIKIYAADNCNPELCSKFLGCSNVESNYNSTQIDSMALISDGEFNLLNTNDCPIELSVNVLDKILSEHNSIDFLLLGYCGAGPYPQCFKLNTDELEKAIDDKKVQFLSAGVRYLERLRPKYYMPFAGTYVLAGSLSNLNNMRGIPELHEALDFYESCSRAFGSKGILLNQNESFDLLTGNQSKEYRKVNIFERDEYIRNVLSGMKFDYELDENIDEVKILEVLPEAFKRLVSKKDQIGFRTNTILFIKLSESSDISVDFTKNTYSIVPNDLYRKTSGFVRIELNNKLLYRLLRGPKYAHWNNAEIGSHLTFERLPNIFERGLYHSLTYFHQ